MSHIRFNIGVPCSGSAARFAEDDSAPHFGSLRPEGGSAARAAEQRNRLEGVPERRSVSIGLRAQGGCPAPSAKSTALPVASVTRRAADPKPSSCFESQTLPVAALSADSMVEKTASSQPPQSVAGRIQLLAKLLFSPGGFASKLN